MTTRQVVLYNGEPIITVTKGKDGAYYWATKAHGMMNHSKKEEVLNYMKRHGYKCVIID